MRGRALLYLSVAILLVAPLQVRAAEEDHTWSLSGTLQIDSTSQITIAVTNDSTIGSITLEVHYDTLALEFVPYADTLGYAIERAAGYYVTPNTGAGYVRLVMVNLQGVESNIAVGSGNVARVAFRVRDGVQEGAATTLTLTPKTHRAVLATRQFEIAGPPPSALEDHTWSISGSIQTGRAVNEVYVAVTNQSAIASAAIEVHYDTLALQLATPIEDNVTLTGRAQDLLVVVTKNEGWDYVRLTIFSTAADPPYPNIEAGSGNVAKLVFQVRPGTAAGSTNLSLTTKSAKNLLATKALQIEEDIWANPGNPAASTWSFTGTVEENATQTEMYINVANSKWLGGLTLDVAFDSTLVQPVAPADQNVRLLRRASDMNLAVAHTSGSGHLRLVVTSPSSVPPFPVIEVGSGPVASLKFNHLAAPAGGATLTFTLRLDDGTLLATKSFSVRSYTGPSADVDGDGQTDIFDLLDFLTKWTKEPPSVFTDVNGDGKTDVFDLLAILKDL